MDETKADETCQCGSGKNSKDCCGA
ncbi:SEC-C metal-binding domain-containing protein [Thermoproteota archaeon]